MMRSSVPCSSSTFPFPLDMQVENASGSLESQVGTAGAAWNHRIPLDCQVETCEALLRPRHARVQPMTTIRRSVLRLLSFFRHDAAEAELSREIRSHLQLLEDEHVAKGMSRDDARLAARRAFGGVEQAKEHQRDARGFRWLEVSRIDLKL